MKKLFPILLLALTLFCGCKPTEKNYRNAYDKAYEASQRRAAEMKSSTDGQTLESLDSPRSETVDGESVMIGRTPVKVYDGAPRKGAGIAIARYSMSTNAIRHADDMTKDYPEAFVATDGDGSFYVVIETVPAIVEASGPIRNFRNSHPEYPYIGLEEGPLVVVITE